MAKSSVVDVTLRPLDVQTVRLRLRGRTDLIMHAWSEKARRMMEEKQQHRARTKKPPKDPDEEANAALYVDPSGYPAMPARAFKAAIVDACRLLDIIPMTTARLALFVVGDWVRIDGERYNRTDFVRLETGVADIRYRPAFRNWSATLVVSYVANILSLEQVINLVNAAGLCGVGDWRPSAPKGKSGTFGMFEVVTDEG